MSWATTATARAEIQAKLQDDSAGVFTTAEIDQGISDALKEFSEIRPKEETTKLITIADSRLVDISSLEDNLLWWYDDKSFNSMYGVEYKLDQWPRKYRNFKVQTDGFIEMDLDNAPSASGEFVKVKYYKAWAVDDIPNQYNPLIANKVMSIVLKNGPNKYINEFMEETSTFTNLTTAIGNMTNRISEAVNNLNEGKSLIGDNIINTQTAIFKITARLTQAVADIATARTYFNSANIGQPEAEYLAASSKEMQAAVDYLNQARGFLMQETNTQSYRNQAIAQLQAANTNLNKARGYAEHIKLRLSKINLADKYFQQGVAIEAAIQREWNSHTIRRTRREWKKT